MENVTIVISSDIAVIHAKKIIGQNMKHKAKCKEREAELREEILFRQPESTHLEATA